MRRSFPAVLLAMAGAAQAATSFSTDVTDLWWNPSESGWGVNLIQQGDIVFATFFVYDAGSRAHWYVASNLAATSNPGDASLTFTGPLYETQGPYFALNFNQAAVSRVQVGTATLRITPPSSGTLSYTVNGTAVTKQIVRQTWAVNDLSGQYTGWRATRVVAQGGCAAGTLTLASLTGVEIATSTTSLTLRGVLGNGAGTCQFNGDYSQEGHLGASSGTYACSSGLQGTYRLSEIEAGLYGFFARFNATERGCPIAGRIGGVRNAIRTVAQ